MNWKQIFRAVVCLLVICCLVFNASAPRAQATGVELIVGTAISVAAVAAVGSMLVGLGVSPGSDQTVFDDLVNGAVDMFEQAGKVVGGMMSVWSLTNSSVKYAIEPEIIEMLREWLFNESVVADLSLDGKAYFNGVLLPVFSLFDDCLYKIIVTNSTTTYYLSGTFKDTYVDINSSNKDVLYITNSDESFDFSITNYLVILGFMILLSHLLMLELACIHLVV